MLSVCLHGAYAPKDWAVLNTTHHCSHYGFIYTIKTTRLVRIDTSKTTRLVRMKTTRLYHFCLVSRDLRMCQVRFILFGKFTDGHSRNVAKFRACLWA